MKLVIVQIVASAY